MMFCRTLALCHGEYSAYDFRDKIYAGLSKYKHTNRSYKILPPFDENRMSASHKKSSDSPDVQEKKPIAQARTAQHFYSAAADCIPVIVYLCVYKYMNTSTHTNMRIVKVYNLIICTLYLNVYSMLRLISHV